jgi:hypothetical protein
MLHPEKRNLYGSGELQKQVIVEGDRFAEKQQQQRNLILKAGVM